MDTEDFNITLPIEMAAMIRGQVEMGAYESDRALIREALDLWTRCRRDRTPTLDLVRAEIDKAARNPRRLAAAEVRNHFERRLLDAESKPPS